MESLVHMPKIGTGGGLVNGTKVVIRFLTVLLCHCGTYIWAATADPGATDHNEGRWPILTMALIIVMLFYTWWLQAQHRRRMEQANEELKRAFDALRESETKFRLLFERSADAILLMDPTKGPKFIDCNDAAVKLLGCSSSQTR